MKDGPDIARVAALIGDPARANILSALMSGQALTATELAESAGVTRSTTSIHLAKLEAGNLVRRTRQGRHRYFALAGSEVAGVLESLMGLAQQTGAVRTRTGPRDPALREARLCYDHLAGEMGVYMLDGLLAKGIVTTEDGEISMTHRGRRALSGLGIDISTLESGRRKLCRGCLDWSMRRDHLAGALGAALWKHIGAVGWAERVGDSRAVRFTEPGRSAFLMTFAPGRKPALKDQTGSN